MNDDTKEIIQAGVQQAVNGGVIATAGAIVSGAATAMVTTTSPITILWGCITIGTATATAPVLVPAVLATAAVGGAVAGGAAGVAYMRRKHKKIKTEFEALRNAANQAPKIAEEQPNSTAPGQIEDRPQE